MKEKTNEKLESYSPEKIYSINFKIAICFFIIMPLPYLVDGEVLLSTIMLALGALALLCEVALKNKLSRKKRIYILSFSEMLAVLLPALFGLGTPHTYTVLVGGVILTGLFFKVKLSIFIALFAAFMSIVFTVFNTYFIPGYNFTYLIWGCLFMSVSSFAAVLFVKIVALRIDHAKKQTEEIEKIVAELKDKIAETENQRQEQAQMVFEIRSIAATLANSADEMVCVVDNLKSGSDRQSAEVEQIANTVAYVSQAGRANAEDAQTAKALFDTSRARLVEGQEQMTTMTAAMGNITETSNQINDILNTINSIASQTNILALNASVEAARAGAAGKGFAVVAQEVRTLATASAEVVKNTGQMINNIYNAVSTGEKTVKDTAQTFKEIANSIDDIMDIIEKINSSSNTQSSSISQVEDNIHGISEVILSNSSTTQQTSDVTHDLHQQIKKLMVLTS